MVSEWFLSRAWESRQELPWQLQNGMQSRRRRSHRLVYVVPVVIVGIATFLLTR